MPGRLAGKVAIITGASRGIGRAIAVHFGARGWFVGLGDIGAAMALRAEAFGMKAWRANGCDYFDTYETMRELLDYVRAGNGPAAIELDTERFYGHFEGDPQRYRGPGELDRIRESLLTLRSARAADPVRCCVL